MHSIRRGAALLAVSLILVGPLGASAQSPAGDKKTGATEVTPLASFGPLSRSLPESLAGIKANGETQVFTRDRLPELVGDKAVVYQEYLVTSAASREYGTARVDVFETSSRFAAFGLVTFNSGASKGAPIAEDLGSGAARLDNEIVFWKGNFFVRVSDVNPKLARGRSGLHEALARGVADLITPTAIQRPPLLDSLPAASIVPGSERYVLGPESLNTYVEHGREMFEFAGDTEAVVADCKQGEVGDVAKGPSAGPGGVTSLAETTPGSRIKLVIVEYHTPQFATDAMDRVRTYLSSLPEDEQQRIIVKRTGNYIVEAVNVSARAFAEGLINSVEYPYTVKWLRNPLWPTNDPFRTQKAAEMLLSTFGLLGLILLTVLVVGTAFGTTMFLKRRKRQQEIFSDAGGMLRLDIDQFESVILGLPPKRSEE